MKNNVFFNLKQTLWVWESRGARIMISTDHETKEIINTKWQIVSVVLKNDTQIERFEAKFENWFMILEKRGISKWEEAEEKQEFKKHWNAGEIGYITVLAHNMIDANWDIFIKKWRKLYFWNTDVYLITQDWENLKMKDKHNTELSLSDIWALTWQNNKVAMDDTDTATFLEDKLWKWLKVNSSKKIDVSFDDIVFPTFTDKSLDLENDSFLTNDFKKVNLYSLLGYVKVIAWENLRKWDVVYPSQNWSYRIFEFPYSSKEWTVYTRSVQPITLKKEWWIISQIWLRQNNWNHFVRLKIFRNYDFANRVWIWLVLERSIDNIFNQDVHYIDVNIEANVTYYVEVEWDYSYWADSYKFDAKYHNIVWLWDITHYDWGWNAWLIWWGENKTVMCWIKLKQTETGKVLTSIDRSFYENYFLDKPPMNDRNFMFSWVAMKDAWKWDWVIVKTFWTLHKNEIRFWNEKRVWKELWDYITIWHI